MTPLPKRTLE